MSCFFEDLCDFVEPCLTTATPTIDATTAISTTISSITSICIIMPIHILIFSAWKSGASSHMFYFLSLECEAHLDLQDQILFAHLCVRNLDLLRHNLGVVGPSDRNRGRGWRFHFHHDVFWNCYLQTQAIQRIGSSVFAPRNKLRILLVPDFGFRAFKFHRQASM